MISQKIRNNASISYFFLGWLFLLAKNNPNYSDIFIKQHAKIATKGHVLFFVSYFLYSHFLSEFFTYSLPLVQITIDHFIQIAFFALLVLFIIHGAYRGQKGDSDMSSQNGFMGFQAFSGDVLNLASVSEGQKMIYILSYVPFLGIIIAKKHPNSITSNGAQVSSLFGFLYILIFISKGFDSLSMVLLFIGVLFLVYIGSCVFIKDTYVIPRIFEKIPKMSLVYEILQTIPLYILDIFRMIFGKKETLNFQQYLVANRVKSEHFQTSLQGYFTDTSISFSPIWIFVPFCNIIFIPKLFIDRKTRYVLAIGQGLVITFLATIIGFFYGFASPYQLFLLFPIFYGIAALETDVFVRIPGIYEIYAILNALTFGILNNTKRIQGIQKENTMVSYKVE